MAGGYGGHCSMSGVEPRFDSTAIPLAGNSSAEVNRSMKVLVLLIVVLIFAGCGQCEDPACAVREEVGSEGGSALAESETGETNDVDRDYAKGVVILKSGERVSGHILLQCPGYLTVCFKLHSSEPDSAQLVRNEDVQSVLLEGDWEDVDPYWRELQKEMTVLAKQAAGGDGPGDGTGK